MNSSLTLLSPTLPESIADGVLLCWHIAPGESVALDQLLAEIETDKVVLEIRATAAGVVDKLLAAEGDIVISEQPLAELTPGAFTSAKPAPAPPAKARQTRAEPPLSSGPPAAAGPATGPAFRLRQRRQPQQAAAPPPAAPEALPPPADERRPMSRLRATIAARMLQARQQTAMLTTFNEVDMTAVNELRRTHRESFEAAHGVRLSIMSFFIRACALSLRHRKVINAAIEGDEILYHSRAHIGVAVSTERGLVVPVLRDAGSLSIAQTETELASLADRARRAKLVPEDLMGGTFTISNGGVFGSLLSTPILNVPQSAILGMHTIQQRPVAVDGQVVVRPMMYLALSYDHRLIDGREAVGFLVSVRDMVQNPSTMLLDL